MQRATSCNSPIALGRRRTFPGKSSTGLRVKEIMASVSPVALGRHRSSPSRSSGNREISSNDLQPPPLQSTSGPEGTATSDFLITLGRHRRSPVQPSGSSHTLSNSRLSSKSVEDLSDSSASISLGRHRSYPNQVSVSSHISRNSELSPTSVDDPIFHGSSYNKYRWNGSRRQEIPESIADVRVEASGALDAARSITRPEIHVAPAAPSDDVRLESKDRTCVTAEETPPCAPWTSVAVGELDELLQSGAVGELNEILRSNILQSALSNATSTEEIFEEHRIFYDTLAYNLVDILEPEALDCQRNIFQVLASFVTKMVQCR